MSELKTELEIERRWVVLDPPGFKKNLGNEAVKSLGNRWRELNITQMYLESEHTERIRQTVEGDKTIYHHTIKKPAKKQHGAWETEREITSDEFTALTARIDHSKQAVIKTRYVMGIVDSELKYELDRIIHPIQTWILEVEVPSIDAEVDIPKLVFGRTIEITKVKGLSNYRIASQPNAANNKIKKLLSKYDDSNKDID